MKSLQFSAAQYWQFWKPQGGTIADLRQFLVEKDFREEFLRTETDREAVYYWQKELPQLAGRLQASLLTRLEYLSPPPAHPLHSRAKEKQDRHHNE